MTDQNNSNISIANSPDPAADRRQQLAALIPEAFSEGQLDVAALKRALGGEAMIEGGERYALTWAGKANAYKVLQTPSTATLHPQRDLSVNFDDAQHVFIEGENLEVLKVLQKAYFGKVKMIYIDPPYNTGSDSFIYPDRFQESKEDYLRRISDLADDGTLMREGFFRKNNKENGHYHSNWLSMMLPRLYIARNLLREDGVIFVSCDDNEVASLKLLMNEIFGEGNFVACICWQKKYAPSNDTVDFSPMHDFILVYGKERKYTDGGKAIALLNRQERTEENNKLYKNPDYDERGIWKSGDYTCNKTADQRPNLYYPIIHPKTGHEVWPNRSAVWRYSKERHEQNVQENRIWWGAGQGNNVPSYKRFISEVSGVIPTTWWPHQDAGHNDEAKKETRLLMGDSGIEFDTPKPVRLLKRMIELATHKPEQTDDDESFSVQEKTASYLTEANKSTRTRFRKDEDQDIVLDFFAGSGTTAQAVLELNQEDGGNRKFILVQLPEKTDTPQYPTIAHITRERIRLVIEKLKTEADLATHVPDDLGFKSYLLTPSNFKQWRGDGIDTPEQLAEQIQMFAKSEKDGAEVEHILYELLLKFGQELTTPVEILEFALTPSPSPGGRGEKTRVFAIHQRKMLFVLETFTEPMIQPMVDMKPREIIVIDGVFLDSDPLKSNLDLQCRDAGIKFTCL